MTDHIIGVHIDDESCDEDHRTDDEPRVSYPRLAIRAVHRCDVEQPVALYVAVDQVPRHRQTHDHNRHLTVAAHEHREDERALEVVHLKQQEEQQVRDLTAYRRYAPQVNHRDEHRHFHQKPADLVVDGRPPLLGTHLAVTGIHKVQRHEDHKSHQRHHEQEIVEEFNRV